MSTSPSSPFSSEPRVAALEALDELIAEVANLQKTVVHELLDRRARLCRELADVDAELADLEASPTPKKKAPVKSHTVGARKLNLQELTAELEAAPECTLNLRKANLDVKHTKALAKANPQRLQLGGKGAWPTLTLRKTPGDGAAGTDTLAAPQDLFAFEETPPGKQGKIG